MAVIAIGNPKGGAGKTTLALVLADTFTANGMSVAVIDADPNAIIDRWQKRRADAGKSIPFTIVPRPSETDMIKTAEALAGEYDMVIIDLEGTASRITSRALARSHLVLVPYNQSPIDAELAASAVSLIHEEGEVLNKKIPFRLVRSRDSAAIVTKSSKRINDEILEAGLPLLSVGLVERAAFRDIFEFGSVLAELDASQTSGVTNAIENAQAVAVAVIEALREEYPA